MIRRREPETSLRWVRDGTGLVLAGIDALRDEDLVAPCGLPHWSRAHLVAHLGLNALALMNLVTWARTGVPHPMYESAARRESDIEQGATWPAAELRDFASRTSAELEAGWASLVERTWTAEVATAMGRTVAASEIPWMRTRELAVHAVDLRAGIEFTNLDDDLNAALIRDVAERRSSLARDPAVQLEADEGGRWRIIGNPSDDASDEAPAPSLSAGSRPTTACVAGERNERASSKTIAGPVAELAAWMTGRSNGETLRSSDGDVPVLTPWL